MTTTLDGKTGAVLEVEVDGKPALIDTRNDEERQIALLELTNDQVIHEIRLKVDKRSALSKDVVTWEAKIPQPIRDAIKALKGQIKAVDGDIAELTGLLVVRDRDVYPGAPQDGELPFVQTAQEPLEDED